MLFDQLLGLEDSAAFNARFKVLTHSSMLFKILRQLLLPNFIFCDKFLFRLILESRKARTEGILSVSWSQLIGQDLNLVRNVELVMAGAWDFVLHHSGSGKIL